MVSKFGQHEHGLEVTVDRKDPKTRELLLQIVKTSDDCSYYLAVALLGIATREVIKLPCKKCLLDAALQFKDVGALLEELANGK